jgi:hypothetical protein
VLALEHKFSDGANGGARRHAEDRLRRNQGGIRAAEATTHRAPIMVLPSEPASGHLSLLGVSVFASNLSSSSLDLPPYICATKILVPFSFSGLLQRHSSAFLVILSESFCPQRVSPISEAIDLGKRVSDLSGPCSWEPGLRSRCCLSPSCVGFRCLRLLATLGKHRCSLLSCREDLRHSGEQTGVQFLALVPVNPCPRLLHRNLFPVTTLDWHFTSMVSP